MPRNIRDRRNPNKRVVHITNRCWHGLPFVPNRTMRRAIEAVLAKAQTLFEVEITCYLFMGNHYHMILTGNAKRVSAFANYVDGEIAKRMMRFFPGRWGPHFWQGRFKEELLPSVDSVIDKIGYILCNPLRAKLVSQLATYPAASSIDALTSLDNKTRNLCSFTFPRFFKPLKSGYISRKRDIELSTQFHRCSDGFFELHTDLFGWLKCFQETRSRKEILDFLHRVISAEEAKAGAQGTIGAERLKNQPLDKPHRPMRKRGDRTPFVSCPDPVLRKRCIVDYRNFQAECRTAWGRIKQGFETTWPRGAFVPSRLWMPLVLPQAG